MAPRAGELIMPHPPIRHLATRLALLTAGLLLTFAVLLLQRGDSDWPRKIGIASAFIVPAAIVVGAFQVATGHRLIWMVELLAIPVVAWLISSAALAVRTAIWHSS